jgi:uncharacterized protein YyaL (SSP411 family)
VRPGKDDKILTSWNALMIDALSRAGVLLDEPRYLEAARRAVAFILEKLTAGGRLLHTWRRGQAKLGAYLDDYAYFINALVTHYEAAFHEPWIDEAVSLAADMLARFEDRERGGFFFTADDHEQLIARNKDWHDASVPSGNAMAATALIRLGKLTGRGDFLDAAGRTLAAARPVIEQSPAAAGQLLIALDLWQGPLKELVLVGGSDEQATSAVLAMLQRSYLPTRVLACRAAGDAPRSGALDPLFAERAAIGGEPTLYVCENFACQAPMVGAQAIEQTLGALP